MVLFIADERRSNNPTSPPAGAEYLQKDGGWSFPKCVIHEAKRQESKTETIPSSKRESRV
jgi:hypothetical protein